MWTNNSQWVPLLNGNPYHHKPPLFFWMIQLGWYIFGVNNWIPRIIPLFFSVGNLFLICQISQTLWPQEKKTGSFAAIILSSCALWSIFSTLIMFDVILTFWVQLGLLGFISAFKKNSIKNWALIAWAVGLGILTKGPVIFLHILPTGLSTPFILQGTVSKKKWYLNISISLFIGILIALLWAVPAAIQGGEEFRNAIFWGQTVNRMVSSFAHDRPFYWYIPFIPVIFFPWTFLKSSWKGLFSLRLDHGTKFCLVWAAPPLLLLSLISGKQLHYLLPLFPAIALLLAKGFVNHAKIYASSLQRFSYAGLLYIAVGAGVWLLPSYDLSNFHRGISSPNDEIPVFYQGPKTTMKKNSIFLGKEIGDVSLKTVINLAASFITLGVIFFFIKQKSMESYIKGIAISLSAFLLLFHIGLKNMWNNYDMQKIAAALKKIENEGEKVGHIGLYEGEFHFLGRLKKPIVMLEDEKKAWELVGKFPRSVVVQYLKVLKVTPEEFVYYLQPYKDRKLVVWRLPESYW